MIGTLKKKKYLSHSDKENYGDNHILEFESEAGLHGRLGGSEVGLFQLRGRTGLYCLLEVDPQKTFDLSEI